MKRFLDRSALLLLTVLLSGAAAQAQSPQPPLTLRQALDIARTRNPNLLSGQQHVIATKANEITAGLRQNPNFTLSGAEVSLPADNPSNPYQYVGNVNRLFERGQKRRWRLDIAHATTDVTQSQYKDSERQTALAVKQAFTQMLAAKAALGIADDNLQGYRKTVDLSKARLDAGDISATDFKRIDLQLADSPQIDALYGHRRGFARVHAQWEVSCNVGQRARVQAIVIFPSSTPFAV